MYIVHPKNAAALRGIDLPEKYWPANRDQEWVDHYRPVPEVLDFIDTVSDYLDPANLKCGGGLVLCGPGSSRNAGYLLSTLVKALGTGAEVRKNGFWLDWMTFVEDSRNMNYEETVFYSEQVYRPRIMVFHAVPKEQTAYAWNLLTKFTSRRYGKGRPNIVTTPMEDVSDAKRVFMPHIGFDHEAFTFVAVGPSAG